MDSPRVTPTDLMPTSIPARTERQAMDWSLVLASQGIEVFLDRDPETARWQLRLADADAGRARDVLREYLRENRGFEWRHEVPGSDYWFDGRVVFWALAVAFVFAWTGGPVESAAFDTERFRAGEWWRAFTAEWLHRDVAHLVSNLVMGLVFLGLATARFGLGVTLSGCLLAGAAANVFAMTIRSDPYRGLGASGLVLAALGMVAAQAIPLWRRGRRGNRRVVSTLGTGALLFILLGTDPDSDRLAHLGGFLGGVLVGGVAVCLPDRFEPGLRRLAWAVFAVLVATTTVLALRG